MDINKLMQQANQLQNQMTKTQEKLNAKEYLGEASSGMVKVVVKGDYQMKSIDIDQELLNADDQDVLQDLIVIAYNNALEELNKDKAEKLGAFTGGMNIPGLF